MIDGVWANEAWGSYWSWDPKETWALLENICLCFHNYFFQEWKHVED